MRNKILTLIMLTAFFSANAIVGVYQTYDDFKNGTPVIFDGDDYSIIGKFLEKKVTGRVKGKETSFLLKDIYGIYDNGDLYRVFNYGGAVEPVKLHTSADYQFYVLTISVENYSDPRRNHTSIISYFSKGLDAPMYRLSSMGNLIELSATHPELKDLVKACEKYKGGAAGRVGKVIYYSPNFKMGRAVVPPVE